MQLSLELKKVQKERGLDQTEKPQKPWRPKCRILSWEMTLMQKKVKQWAFQVQAYFVSQVINMDVDQLKLA
jgi:hypothetical protein